VRTALRRGDLGAEPPLFGRMLTVAEWAFTIRFGEGELPTSLGTKFKSLRQSLRFWPIGKLGWDFEMAERIVLNTPSIITNRLVSVAGSSCGSIVDHIVSTAAP
jgi:hypothetical protein